MQTESPLLKSFVQVSILFSFGYIINTYFTGFTFARYLIISCLPVFLTLLYLTRYPRWIPLLSQVFIGVCTSIVYLLSLYSGSLDSLVLPWFTLIPVICLLLAGFRSTTIWSLISVILLLSMVGVDVSTSPLNFIPPNRSLFNVSLSMGLLGIVAWMVSLFSKRQRELQKQLSTSISDMKATDEELRQNMEELSTIQDLLQQSNNQLVNTMSEISESNKKLGEKGRELLEKQKRLQFYADVLQRITKLESLGKGDLEAFFQDLLRITADSLKITRASVWFFINENRSIECRLLFMGNLGTFDRGLKLHATDFPKYFEYIRQEQLIVATHAEEHPATREFKEVYLLPNQIRSMLDTPIMVDGEIQGVLCLEQQFQPFEWNEEEKSFARSLGDLVSLGIQSHYSHQAKFKLEEQANQIFEQHQELLNYANEIKRLNETLEERVIERTLKLEEQNRVLTEYAYINAHLLRGPLCRIQGLQQLLTFVPQEERPQLMELMKVATRELDDVIKRITHSLESGQQLMREEISN